MIDNKLHENSIWVKDSACSPPDGPDRGDADGGRLAVMKAADSGLEELLDELRRHGCREATGRPQSSAQEERRRRWSEGKKRETTVRPLFPTAMLWLFNLTVTIIRCNVILNTKGQFRIHLPS